MRSLPPLGTNSASPARPSAREWASWRRNGNAFEDVAPVGGPEAVTSCLLRYPLVMTRALGLRPSRRSDGHGLTLPSEPGGRRAGRTRPGKESLFRGARPSPRCTPATPARVQGRPALPPEKPDPNFWFVQRKCQSSLLTHGRQFGRFAHAAQTANGI